MYVLCAFLKEGMADTFNVLDHLLWKVVEGHKVKGSRT